LFRTVSPSIIRSLRLYIQHQVYVIQVLWQLAGVKDEWSYTFDLPIRSHGVKRKIPCLFTTQYNERNKRMLIRFLN